MPRNGIPILEIFIVTISLIIPGTSTYGLEQTVLGESVSLGTLYDVRTGRMYNGFQLWKNETLEENVWPNEAVTLKQDIYVESTSSERAHKFGVGAELELGFMSGLITVKGSAEYITDEKKSSNVARVVMSSETVTLKEEMDTYMPPDFDFCHMVKENSGPTHAVVSITYGQRGYFVFEKTAKSKLQLDSLSGSLEAKIDLIPDLVSIEGGVAIHTNGSEYKNDEEMSVKFYGDAILESVPRNFIQAVDCYNKVVDPTKAGQNPSKSSPIRYHLKELKDICRNANPTIIKISQEMISDAVAALNSLKAQQLRVNALLDSEPALRYTAIRSQLNIFKIGLDKYYNSMASGIAKLLPAIKSGQADESGLRDIINAYTESSFEESRSSIFLDQREVEIETILQILENALKDSKIALSDIKDATDNECIFKAKYGTVFKLDILPLEDTAQRFVESNGSWTESDAWFRTDETVAKIGRIKRTFEDYVEINQKHSDSQCFLVKLDNLNNEKQFEMALYYKGKQLTDTFDPPTGQPSTPSCMIEKADGFLLETTASDNPDITGQLVSITWPNSNNGFFYSSQYITGNTRTLNVIGLEPYTVYTMTTKYVVLDGQGVSEESESVTCTTRPFSSPSVLTVSDSTENSLVATWSKPTLVAHALRNSDLNYRVEVWQEEGVILKSEVVTGLRLQIAGLDPATVYSVSVVAELESSQVESEAAVTQFATTPSAPDAPTIAEEPGDNRATFDMAISSIEVPSEMTKEAVLIKYYKMEDNKKVDGTERVFGKRIMNEEGGEDDVVNLESLASGTTYGVQVKLMVKFGDCLFTTAYSDPTSVKTTEVGSDISKIREIVNEFEADAKRNLDNTKAKSDHLSDQVKDVKSQLSDGVSDAQTAIQELKSEIPSVFHHLQAKTSSLQKSQCVMTGYELYPHDGSDLLDSLFNVHSMADCLARCADRDDCVSVTLFKETHICQLSAKRMGFMMHKCVDCQSVGLYCPAADSASINAWKTCIVEADFQGSDLEGKTSTGINNIQECVAICQITDNCHSVTYDKVSEVCHLKSKRNGDNTVPSNYAQSLNMACLVATRSTSERCEKTRTIYSGSEIESNVAPTLQECIANCANLNLCESVSYNEGTGTCISNSKRLGEYQTEHADWTSVNMYCLGLQTV